jgi:ParB family chromosome partitioning protein
MPTLQTLIAVPVAEITQAEKRMRPLYDHHVEMLAGLLKTHGQLQPIIVCQLPGRSDFMLLDGAHRLAAARRLGWTEIRAIKVGNKAGEQRAHELFANSAHLALNALDRIAMVAVLYAEAVAQATGELGPNLYKAIADARWKPGKTPDDLIADASATVADAFGWSAAVAERAGISERSVQRYAAIHERLSPTAVELIRQTSVADHLNQLQALSKLPEAKQIEVATSISEGVEFADAIASAPEGKPKQTASQKAVNALESSVLRISGAELEDAFQRLARQAKTRGWVITFKRAAK